MEVWEEKCQKNSSKSLVQVEGFVFQISLLSLLCVPTCAAPPATVGDCGRWCGENKTTEELMEALPELILKSVTDLCPNELKESSSCHPLLELRCSSRQSCDTHASLH
ncbi:hypothetical protein AMECASPLE_001750 [Ameca splendens]|uniref:Uncharacterized protein n=1 Tax=Ameca splendens TaxID=208324 RepID=A0ABV0XM33_9TELE